MASSAAAPSWQLQRLQKLQQLQLRPYQHPHPQQQLLRRMVTTPLTTKATVMTVRSTQLFASGRTHLGLRKLTDEEYEEACGMVERLEATLAAKIEDATDWETSRGYITGLPYTFYDKL
ncbi:hypothetical protein PC121_g20120 [Phytophthora cactorum]|nr:hypothetical protein PC120_g20705 [Phytophthora cactorum]KAG3047348.1 hypothetical protein PC121_g20120 [Phytophthora cactorum]